MVTIPSHRYEFAIEAQKCLLPVLARIHNGCDYPSFSKLMNDCILLTPGETVIICNDKVRTGPDTVQKTLKLLDSGYGFVALGAFRFFGFRKDLVRRIGWFDERYVGGEYEDFDWMRRIKEADIAVYVDKAVDVEKVAPSWNSGVAKAMNQMKWREMGTTSVRMLPDPKYPAYDAIIGPMRDSPKWKPYSESVLVPKDTPKEFVVSKSSAISLKTNGKKGGAL